MTERLMVLAPRLPPTRSIVFLFGARPKLSRDSSTESGVESTFCRTGLPVMIILSAGKKRSIPS